MNKETKKKRKKRKTRGMSAHFIFPISHMWSAFQLRCVLCTHRETERYREHNDTRILPFDYVCLPAIAAKS